MIRFILTLVMFVLIGGSSSQHRQKPERVQKISIEKELKKEEIKGLVEEIVLIDTLCSIMDKKIELSSEIFEERYRRIVEKNKEKDVKIKQLEKEQKKQLSETERLIQENQRLKDSLQILTINIQVEDILKEVKEVVVDSVCRRRKMLGIGKCSEWEYLYKGEPEFELGNLD